MNDRDLKIEEKKLALERRGQNLSLGKFVVGVFLLGVVGYTSRPTVIPLYKG